LIRAIVMFWAYSACARNTLEYHGGYAGCSMNTLEGTGIFDYYSNIDLLEARAVFDYFESLVHVACHDAGMEGDDHYRGFVLDENDGLRLIFSSLQSIGSFTVSPSAQSGY
jgi:hypothetical protein